MIKAIEEDHIGSELPCRLDGRAAFMAEPDLEADRLEEPPGQAGRVGVIVHEEDTPPRPRYLQGSRWLGLLGRRFDERQPYSERAPVADPAGRRDAPPVHLHE